MIRRIAVAGAEFALADEGPQSAPDSAQSPLVLLHGFTGSKDSWIALRDKLSAVRRVLSFDLPGHGDTSVSDPAVYSMEHCAQWVLAALATLRVTRFTLMGYSMGARLALYCALSRPGSIDRLILESASAGLEHQSDRDDRIQADERLAQMLEREGIEAFVRYWEDLRLFASIKSQPESLRRDLTRARLACDAAGLATSLRGMGTGCQPWLGSRLHELSIPVLLIAGDQDHKYSAIAAWMHRAIPAAELRILPACGHIPHLERADLFIEIVSSFIRESRPTPVGT